MDVAGVACCGVTLPPHPEIKIVNERKNGARILEVIGETNLSSVISGRVGWNPLCHAQYPTIPALECKYLYVRRY